MEEINGFISKARHPLKDKKWFMAGAFLIFAPSAFSMPYTPDVTVCLSGCDQLTIQAGIDAATAGQAILVLPGIYNESIVLDQDKTLFSLGLAFTTTIDASGLDNRIASIGSGSTLDGFVITGGSIIGDGGGVAAGIGSTITNNLITGNHASANGGGLSSVASTVTQNVISNNTSDNKGGGAVLASGTNFSENTVENNSSIDGAGILLHTGSLVSKSIIRGNTAAQYGGGVYFEGRYSHSKITNSLIVDNSAQAGGGIQFTGYSYAKVFHSTISGNTANEGAGINPWSYSQGLISNVISWGNNGADIGSTRYGAPSFRHSVINQNPPFYGVINQDPLFKDAATGDYRLEFGSAAIDTGSNTGETTEDINSVSRPQDGDGMGSGGTGDGSDFDIGAYEATVEMCTS